MKPNRWLIGLCVALVVLFVASECSSDTSEHVEAAQSLQDSLGVLASVRASAEATAAAQDTLVAELRASLEGERNARVADRAQTDVLISDARETGAAALDSARLRVSDEIRVFLDEHAAEDSVMVAGYESQIVSLEADTVAMSLELVETRRQALFNRRGWDLADESLVIAVQMNKEWRAAYVAQKRKGLLTNVGSGVLLVLALVVR